MVQRNEEKRLKSVQAEGESPNGSFAETYRIQTDIVANEQ